MTTKGRFQRIAVIVVLCLSTFGCENDLERRIRLEKERVEKAKEDRFEAERQQVLDREDERRRKEREYKEEQARIKDEENKRQRALEEERRRIIKQYGENSLANGSIPWKGCFGRNAGCDEWGCSQIAVHAAPDSDVLVLIKRNGQVKKHAYIRAGMSYTFQMPDGVYQPFFYSGAGWYPNKVMNSKLCKTLTGGFVKDENWLKDQPQRLENQILTYSLEKTVYGNAQTVRQTNEEDAL